MTIPKELETFITERYKIFMVGYPAFNSSGGMLWRVSACRINPKTHQLNLLDSSRKL